MLSVIRSSFINRHLSGEEDSMEELMKHRADLDKLNLKLFDIACRTEKPLKALEICSGFYIDKSFSIAYNLAAKAQMTQLAEKIERIRQVNICIILR